MAEDDMKINDLQLNEQIRYLYNKGISIDDIKKYLNQNYTEKEIKEAAKNEIEFYRNKQRD